LILLKRRSILFENLRKERAMKLTRSIGGNKLIEEVELLEWKMKNGTCVSLINW